MSIRKWGEKLIERRELLVHLLLLYLYFASINVEWTENWLDPTDRPSALAPLTVFLFPLVFYLNAFYFIPRFLSGKKWYRYFLITIPILIITELLRASIIYLSTSAFDSFQQVLLHSESFVIGRPNMLFSALILSFGYRFSMDWIRNRKTIAQLEAEKSKMELALLKSQIDPHFLFNNLNALDDLIDRKPQEAREYVQRLSSLYRYTILNMEQDVVQLSEEWTFVENYVYLMQQRFGEAYQFNMENTLGENYLIPPSALQSLVENAVKHNIGDVENPLKVEIIANEEGITVRHQKRLKKQVENSLGTGLKNLTNRYQLLTNKDILIRSDEDFVVSLPLILKQ